MSAPGMPADIAVDLSVDLCGIRLRNPVLAASGTFGFGREMAEVFPLSSLGGIVSKGITLLPRRGNPPPRVAETASGMLNSVGLQNPGIEAFLREELPFMVAQGCAVAVNIAGAGAEEYEALVERLDRTPVDLIEVNLSCPNVREGCMAFGATARGVESLVSRIRPRTRKPLAIKLTPQADSISETARAAESAGADAVSLVNTLLGMAIDIETRRPVLANNVGGLSGPAILPVALRMVHEVAGTVRIPVIGMGGIQTGQDAIAFLLAGATAIQVGTATLINPTACQDVVNEIASWMRAHSVPTVRSLIGDLRLNP